MKVEIDAASIDTRNADRDGHLKGNDFFDMENYPQITFTSTGIRADDRELIVDGALTINADARVFGATIKAGETFDRIDVTLPAS